MFKSLVVLLLVLPAIFADCPSGSVQWPPSPPANCFTFMSTPKKFSDAEDTCKKSNGHLASIHEAFTNSFIGSEGGSELNVKDFWIGANTLPSGGKWTWTDGSPTDFNDFGNSTQASGNCGVMNTKDINWYLKDCSISKPFVCQFPEDVVLTTPNTKKQ